jgi:hypothetical protein
MKRFNNIQSSRILAALLFPAFLILASCTSHWISSAKGTDSSTAPLPTSDVSTVPFGTATRPPTERPPTLQIPTLTSEEADTRIEQLVQNESSCPDLPCFWGITPGVTSLAEAQNILATLRIPLTESEGAAGERFYSASFKTGIGTHGVILLQVDSERVSNISARMDLANSVGSKTTAEWPAYSPEHLLTKYGEPSSVGFRLNYPHESGFPPQTAWYDLVMSFKGLNLTTEYTHGLTKEAASIEACPLQNSFSSIGIWIGPNPPNLPSSGKSLAQAASLSLGEFRDLMLSGVQKTCLDLSPRAFYPQP